MSKYAIQVNDVKKSFFLPHHKNNSLKSSITQFFKTKNKGGETFNALNGVSFNVEKGDFFGILGRNGSGKSTLLKIISEIYQPTSGSVKREGKLVSFIELGVGFKSELTGRENVFLNGALLGFSKDEVAAMYDDIVSFAELEQFMDQKLKNYSSGMKVRLAFSVAIRAKADVLILDEVLAVGDASFQKKCTNYFETLKNDGKTVILVTHTMGHVKRFCNKAVVIDDGKVIYDGTADEAAEKYTSLFDDKKAKSTAITDRSETQKQADVTMGEVTVGEYVDLPFTIRPSVDLAEPVVAILIYRGDEQVVRWVSDEKAIFDIELKQDVTFKATLRTQNIFKTGNYSVNVLLRNRNKTAYYGEFVKVSSFDIVNDTPYRHNTLWRPTQRLEINE